jgi:hypothetical protein
MKSMVLGVVGLVSALTHVEWRGEAMRDVQGRLAAERRTVLSNASRDSSAEPAAAAAAGFARDVDPSEDNRDRADGDVQSGDAIAAGDDGGDWELGCQIKLGDALLFDRASVREYGAVTLFRWTAAADAGTPDTNPRIFTAVANCREKTIEASWPGKNRETRAGTCGRGLIEAVCAAAAQTSSAAKARRPGPRDGDLPPRR